MDLDMADDGPSSSTSAGPSQQQQEQASQVIPVTDTLLSANVNGAAPLLYAFEMEGLPPSHVTGTNDLLTAFGLARTYDRAVRQYLVLPGAATVAAGASIDIKGKGRAMEFDYNAPSPSAAKLEEGATAGVAGKGKMMKKHYSHMIADVPGQNKLAKDHHLRDLLMNPEPPDHVNIALLDDTALREAFTLEVGMLPDFDATIWRADADENRRKKKKRKQEEGATANLNGVPSPAVTGSGPGGTATTKKRRME